MRELRYDSSGMAVETIRQIKALGIHDGSSILRVQDG